MAVRRYDVRVEWQNKGRGYLRQAVITVRASSLVAAVRLAAKQAKRDHFGWREAEGSVFRFGVTVGTTTHREEKEETP